MACFKPLKGFRSKEPNLSGKHSITFNESHGDSPLVIACSQCLGCRIDRSKQWAVRIMHEASLHDQNCFLTLTYEDSKLPEWGTLVKRHHQLFMKRLRKHIFPTRVGYFQCGEYGDLTYRPHYHSCLFGYDFQDKKFYKSENGNDLYTSKSLEKLWGHGFATIGSLTFQSAAYVARYILKKVTGRESHNFYTDYNPETGEFFDMLPEYVTMSRRPPIAKKWYEKFSSDVFPSDEVILKGKTYPTPKYYLRQLEKLDPDLFSEIKALRENEACTYNPDTTPARLAAREAVLRAQIQNHKRNLK